MKLAMLTSMIDRQAREEGFIVDWVEALAQEVDELVVFVLRPQKTKLKANNVSVYNLGQSRTKMGKLILLFRWFWREHRIQPFDGIFSHMYDFLGVAAGLLGKCFRTKSVFWYAWGGSLKKKSLAKLALELNAEIVTCSETMKARYQKAFHLTKPIHVFGHAISTKHFLPTKKKKRDNLFSIGFVGRLSPNKNIESLINACQKLRLQKRLKLILVLSRTTTHPEYLRQIEKLIKKSKTRRLEFEVTKDVPYSKIPKVYQELDLYVHPGLIYSVDKAGLEAICAGVPVLLSRYGYKEICRGHEELLFDPCNSDQLANKIQNAIENEEDFIRRQKLLQKFIRSKYSTEAFMEKLRLLY